MGIIKLAWPAARSDSGRFSTTAHSNESDWSNQPSIHILGRRKS